MGPPGAIFVVLSLWCGCLLLLVRLFPGRRFPRRRLEAPWSRMGLFGQRRSRVELPAATQLSLGAAQFSMVDAATSRQSSHTCARSLTECSWSSDRFSQRHPLLQQRLATLSLGQPVARARALATSLEVAASVPKRPIMHQKASCFTLLHRCSASALKFNLLGE